MKEYITKDGTKLKVGDTYYFVRENGRIDYDNIYGYESPDMQQFDVDEVAKCYSTMKLAKAESDLCSKVFSIYDVLKMYGEIITKEKLLELSKSVNP